MMIATERAISGSSGSAIARSPRSDRIRVIRFIGGSGYGRGARRPPSYLHDLRFFAFQEVVELVHVVVGQLLQALLGTMLLVRADVSPVDELLEVVHDVASHVADGDTPFFRQVADDLD